MVTKKRTTNLASCIYAASRHRFCHVRKVKNANDILLWQAGGRQTINWPPFHVLCVRARISMSTGHHKSINEKRLFGTVFSSLPLTDWLNRIVQVKVKFHFADHLCNRHTKTGLCLALSVPVSRESVVCLCSATLCQTVSFLHGAVRNFRMNLRV